MGRKVDYDTVLECATRCIYHKQTVRYIAKELGISKSTVHNHLRKHLKELSLQLAQEADKVLIENKKEGQLKGGESTRRLWIQKRKSSRV